MFVNQIVYSVLFCPLLIDESVDDSNDKEWISESTSYSSDSQSGKKDHKLPKKSHSRTVMAEQNRSRRTGIMNSNCFKDIKFYLMTHALFCLFLQFLMGTCILQSDPDIVIEEM